MTRARFPSVRPSHQRDSGRTAEGLSPLPPGGRGADARYMSKPLAVSDVTTKDVLCVHPYATFEDIVLLLARYRVHALPVVDVPQPRHR